jgi:hypothetical protein
MNARTRLTSLSGATLLLVGAVSVALAQPAQTGRRSSPMYDVKTEVTITGTVEGVDTITDAAAPGRRGLGGTHLVVKTATEAIAVHVGPTAYLAENAIAFAKGDVVEVLGSRVTSEEKPILIAKRIKKGDKTWTLRDASGRPLWSGRQR